MTRCKECHNAINTRADACPHCGLKQERSRIFGNVGLTVISAAAILALGAIYQVNTTKPIPITSHLNGNTLPASAPVLGDQWDYSQQKDDMSQGVTYSATVQSTNTVEFESPYSGAQHALLQLRTHPRLGKDVILRIERGQILCRSYENCEILIRFDEQKAQKFTAIGPSDNSTDTVFIRNYAGFTSLMGKAKRVRIAVPIYQEGEQTFEFHVAGFAKSKYLATRSGKVGTANQEILQKKTHACMVNATKEMVAKGEKMASVITRYSVALCGAELSSSLSNMGGLQKKEVEDVLYGLAYSALTE